MVDESVGLEVRQRGGIRRETPEVPSSKIGKRIECTLLRRSLEYASFPSGKCPLANRTRFKPFGDAFIHPGWQFEPRRLGIERRMNEFVMQHAHERGGHSLVASDMNRAPIKTSCGKTKQPPKACCKNFGVPDVDIDLSLGPQIQKRVESIVGSLEFPKNLLFEMSGSAQAPTLIEIDILKEPEVKRVAPSESTIRAGVADRKRHRRHQEQPGSHHACEAICKSIQAAPLRRDRISDSASDMSTQRNMKQPDSEFSGERTTECPGGSQGVMPPERPPVKKANAARPARSTILLKRRI